VPEEVARLLLGISGDATRHSSHGKFGYAAFSIRSTIAR
jgi:hypothetical protein